MRWGGWLGGALFLAVITGAVLIAVAMLSKDYPRATAVLDDYQAGYSAVAPRKAVFDDLSQKGRQDRCYKRTRSHYDGDPGFLADSSDGAMAFSMGCMNASSGQQEITSGRELSGLFDED
jgi:hypothetical protein